VIEPLPRWARWFFVAVAVAAAVLVVNRASDDGVGAPQPATWRVAPSADLGPASRRVPVLVGEAACASGRTAEGRIEAAATYEADVVVIEIAVRPLGGSQDCQGNPATPYVVELTQPLGQREVAGMTHLP
jgi:hypothetical protein